MNSPDGGIEELLAEVAAAWRRIGNGEAGPATAPAPPAEVRRIVMAAADFSRPRPGPELVRTVAGLLARWGPQVTHPRYFGLFNPSVLPVTVAADALVAAANPQLALRAHAPAASEIERCTLAFFRGRTGLPGRSAAHFTSGGQEANLTAVLAALSRLPGFAAGGVRALPAPPTLYLSAGGHASFEKVARATGLGDDALCRVAEDGRGRMDVDALARCVEADRREGRLPLLVAATAGTTAAGAIDPLPAIAELCRREKLWFHVDAAWGGLALLSPRLRSALSGIEAADSVTWDAHKGLFVPMGAGMFFCRHPRTAAAAFRTAPSPYAPPGAGGARDPYQSTLLWSRRFTGLKLFLALAERGEAGIAALVEHQAAMADRLRERATAAGFRVTNQTPLPLVCLTHPEIEKGAVTTRAAVRRILARGRCWVSETEFLGRRVVRACVTSWRTGPADVQVLVEELTEAVRRRRRPR